MASKRMTVWQLLSRLGHGGDREEIIQHVFETSSRVTLRSGGGEPVDGGEFLVEVFESLGTTTDWPPCGSHQWTRLREVVVRRIIARLAREGLLDAVAVGGDGGTATPEGNHHDPRGAPDAEGSGDGGRSPDDAAPCHKSDTRGKNGAEARGGTTIPDAGNGDACDETDAIEETTQSEVPRIGSDEVPGIGVGAAAAMLRRMGDNPGVGFRCLKRDTPMSVIRRWARGACPDVPPEGLVALADELGKVAYRAEDGHLLGGVMIRALEEELEEGCDDERWMLVVSDFDEAIGTLRSVFERLALL